MLKKITLLVFVLLAGFANSIFAKNISIIKNDFKIIFSVPNSSKLNFIAETTANGELDIEDTNSLMLNIGLKKDPLLIHCSLKSKRRELHLLKSLLHSQQKILLVKPSAVKKIKNDNIEGYYVYGTDKIWDQNIKGRSYSGKKSAFFKKYKLYLEFNYKNKVAFSFYIAANDIKDLKERLKIASTIKVIDLKELNIKRHKLLLANFLGNLELLKIKHKSSNLSKTELKNKLISSASPEYLAAINQAIIDKSYDLLELHWYKSRNARKRLIILSYFYAYVKEANIPNFVKSCGLFKKDSAFFRGEELKFILNNQEMVSLVLKETHEKNSRKTLKAVLEIVKTVNNKGDIIPELRLFPLDAPKYSGIRISPSEMPLFTVIYENYFNSARDIFVEIECKLSDNMSPTQIEAEKEAYFVAENIKIVDYKSAEKHKFPGILSPSE